MRFLGRRHRYTPPVPSSAVAPRASDRVTRHVLAHIRQHQLEPGARLPSELHWSRELCVSRGIVREAYRWLRMAGILVTGSGRSPRVGQLTNEAITLILEHALATAQVSSQQVMDLRAPIEIRAAELAAATRTDTDAEILRKQARALRRANTNLDALIAADVEFHEALGRATGNLLFSVVGGALRDSLRSSMWAGLSGRSREGLQRVFDIHDAIAEAIGRRDATAARQEMTKHFQEALAGLQGRGDRERPTPVPAC